MGPKIVNSARSYSCLQIQNQGRSIVVLGYIIVREGDGRWGDGEEICLLTKITATAKEVLPFKSVSHIQ